MLIAFTSCNVCFEGWRWHDWPPRGNRYLTTHWTTWLLLHFGMKRWSLTVAHQPAWSSDTVWGVSFLVYCNVDCWVCVWGVCVGGGWTSCNITVRPKGVTGKEEQSSECEQSVSEFKHTNTHFWLFICVTQEFSSAGFSFLLAVGEWLSLQLEISCHITGTWMIVVAMFLFCWEHATQRICETSYKRQTVLC